MKLRPPDGRDALSISRLAAALFLIAIVPLVIRAAVPVWWRTRGVLVENASNDDYAPINQGQLKNIAKAAVTEMDARLTNGAGNELHAMIDAWSALAPNRNDFAPVNLGQLKATANPFYDRLMSVGLLDAYPWLTSQTLPDDFSIANNGQVKNLFNFNIPAPNTLQDVRGDRLAAGEHSANLALESYGVWIWGNHFIDGTDFERNYPVRIASLSAIKSVAAGQHHLVALQQDGTVRTWGDNSQGQLGDGTSTKQDAPALVPHLANVVSVKAGAAHTLALGQDGTVLAWGDNYYGQLGTGDTTSSAVPVSVAGLDNVIKIAAGVFRSVALKVDTTVWIWGYDHYVGQDIYNPIPVQVPDLVDVLEVAAGYEHTVAVKSDGTVWTWGSNYYDQLGNASPRWIFQAAPLQVPGLTHITKVASAYDHTLALQDDGTVWAWGYNAFGQLGDGTDQPRKTPVKVVGLTDVVALATASAYSLAMKADGTVWAWGDSAPGIIAGLNRRIPQQVGLGLFDTNHNGLDDRWEAQFFGNLNQTADVDFDGDGVSNLKEFFRGTNPADYYNGVTPTIEIAGGNNQLGDPGTFLAKPYKVRVRSSDGRPLVNAPVTFTVTSGGGALAVSSNSTQQQAIAVRTDVSGEAAVYHILPDTGGISTRTNAIAGPAEATASVTIRGISRLSLPPPSPTPTPDPSATPSPSGSPSSTPAARPIAPYRYAIIDLGRDVYPKRINNNGWILCDGPDPNGNSGPFRWKAGKAEFLEPSPTNNAFSAVDINDDGIVVGWEQPWYDAYRHWVINAVNEFSAGLTWAPTATRPTRLAGPIEPNWNTFSPGWIQLAFFSAIANRNALTNQTAYYGSVYLAEGTYSWLSLFDYHPVLNAQRWLDSAGPMPLSFSNSTVNFDQWPFPVFDWRGPMDRVSRANAAGHYIGSRLTPTPNKVPPADSSGMIDGVAVDFDPVDINQTNIVVGSNGAGMIIRVSGQIDLVFAGSYPLAINDHTRPAPAIVPQPSPTATPQPTPIPAPQVLGWTGNALVLWELQTDGKTWHPFGLEEMIPSMDGWQYLEAYDMNDNGAIIGRGWYTDPSHPGAPTELHGFLLVPCELMVDGNRDGEMSFDDPVTHANDETSEDKPYRFWLNNDHDEERAVDTNDREQDDYDAAPDFDNPALMCERDLEDWSRLWISLRGIVGLIKSPGATVELSWKPIAGGNAWLASDGSPGIKIILQDSQAGAGASDARYLFDKNAATIQAHGIWGGVIRPVSQTTPCVVPTDFLQFVTEEKPFLYLLFEGWTAGKGQLVVKVKKDGKLIAQLPGLHLDLKDVKSMYERYSVGDVPQPNTSIASSIDDSVWPADRPALLPDPSGKPFEPPLDEENNYILWVHGWNMSVFDKDSYADTAFKRLFWQGYKGRFGTFRWPTFFFTSDIPPLHHFDASEHRAWASSLGLLALFNQLNAGPFAGNIRVMAHSMGNVVASEAIRRSNSGQVVHTYVASQAAISAHMYDVAAPAMQYDANLGPTTPNVFGYYWLSTTTSQPHEWGPEGKPSYMHSQYLNAKVGRCFNYYNEDDWALTWPRWQLDQQTKPDADYGYEYSGMGTSRGFWRDRGLGATWLTFPSDRYEIFAWTAESRSYALGAQWVAGMVTASTGENVDLRQPPFNFAGQHKYHSGQFRGMNMERCFYWKQLLISFGLKEAQ